MLAQESIGDALSILFTQRGLYQKVDLSFDAMSGYLEASSKKEISYFRATCKSLSDIDRQ